MKVFISRRDGSVNAEANYDVDSGKMVVLKGSVISPTVRVTQTFSTRKIELLRKEHVKNGVLIDDVEFKSSTTAANFVLGSSSNGLRTWKDKDGNNLKSLVDSE